jgi:ribosomal protein S12 methylthiotransferase
VPGIALRTALIVGLPGETEEDFDDLLSFVREQRFERLGVFEYSQEEGTLAATLPGQIAPELKRARRDAIMEVQQEISRELQEAMIGRRVEVLVEGRSEETEHLLVGRNAQQAPEIDGVTYLNEFADGLEPVAYPGEIVTVEITEAGDYDLVGRVVSREAPSASRRLPTSTGPAVRPLRVLS